MHYLINHLKIVLFLIILKYSEKDRNDEDEGLILQLMGQISDTTPKPRSKISYWIIYKIKDLIIIMKEDR